MLTVEGPTRPPTPCPAPHPPSCVVGTDVLDLHPPASDLCELMESEEELAPASSRERSVTLEEGELSEDDFEPAREDPHQPDESRTPERMEIETQPTPELCVPASLERRTAHSRLGPSPVKSPCSIQRVEWRPCSVPLARWQPRQFTDSPHDLPLLKWISPNTQRKIDQALQTQPGEKAECRLCGKSGTEKRVRFHIKQHYSVYFCACGFFSPSRDTIDGHHRDLGKKGEMKGHGRAGCNFQVDADRYPEFVAYMGWRTSPPFPVCVPTYVGKAQSVPRVEPPLKRVSKSTKKRNTERQAVYERATTLRQSSQRPHPAPSSSPSSVQLPRVPLATFLSGYRIPRREALRTVPSPVPDSPVRSHLGVEIDSPEGEVSPVPASPPPRLRRIQSVSTCVAPVDVTASSPAVRPAAPLHPEVDNTSATTVTSPAVRPAAPLHPEVDYLPADVRELLPLLMPLRREELQGVPAGRTAMLDVMIDEGQVLYDQGLAILREAQARFSCARLFSKV